MQSSSNGLKDSKPTKIKLLPVEDGLTNSRSMKKPTTLRFNLNKPCSELFLYLMPCGGGSINFELHHGNTTLAETKNVDSFSVVKVSSPKKGRYLIKIFQSLQEPSHARMVEVYVGKKNRRFPLPKLPGLIKQQ